MTEIVAFRKKNAGPLSARGPIWSNRSNRPKAAPAECSPYDLVLRTDASVPFPLGKDGSGVLANCSLCGIKATLFFSAGPVCSSISVEACTILHALCWSRQHQQVCHFSSLLLLSDSRSVLATLFSSPSFLLPQSLSETVFSLLQFHQAAMGPRTLVSSGRRLG